MSKEGPRGLWVDTSWLGRAEGGEMGMVPSQEVVKGNSELQLLGKSQGRGCPRVECGSQLPL